MGLWGGNFHNAKCDWSACSWCVGGCQLKSPRTYIFEELPFRGSVAIVFACVICLQGAQKLPLYRILLNDYLVQWIRPPLPTSSIKIRTLWRKGTLPLNIKGKTTNQLQIGVRLKRIAAVAASTAFRVMRLVPCCCFFPIEIIIRWHWKNYFPSFTVKSVTGKPQKLPNQVHTRI